MPKPKKPRDDKRVRWSIVASREGSIHLRRLLFAYQLSFTEFFHGLLRLSELNSKLVVALITEIKAARAGGSPSSEQPTPHTRRSLYDLLEAKSPIRKEEKP